MQLGTESLRCARLWRRRCETWSTLSATASHNLAEEIIRAVADRWWLSALARMACCRPCNGWATAGFKLLSKP
jgi:hypothetical protein